MLCLCHTVHQLQHMSQCIEVPCNGLQLQYQWRGRRHQWHCWDSYFIIWSDFYLNNIELYTYLLKSMSIRCSCLSSQWAWLFVQSLKTASSSLATWKQVERGWCWCQSMLLFLSNCLPHFGHLGFCATLLMLPVSSVMIASVLFIQVGVRATCCVTCTY